MSKITGILNGEDVNFVVTDIWPYAVTDIWPYAVTDIWPYAVTDICILRHQDVQPFYQATWVSDKCIYNRNDTQCFTDVYFNSSY